MAKESMEFHKDKIIPRYTLITILFVILGFAIIGSTIKVMFVQREFWNNVAKRLVANNVPIKPTRGNILSADGKVVASSLPEFKLFIDFRSYVADSAKRERDQFVRDSTFRDKIDSIADGLHDIFQDKSSSDFKVQLLKGLAAHKQHWPIYRRRATYSQMKMVTELPIFREGNRRSGLHMDTINTRKKPFGSLAFRTFGDVYGQIDSARCGIELSFDSILRGVPGKSHRQKVHNKWISITDQPPVDGFDIVTTIDVGMQDIAERALVNKLKEINGEMGLAVLMETATGDVKAIVNMSKCHIPGTDEVVYREVKNNAIGDLREPGSTFKTASIMVALDDGKIDTTMTVDTYGGRYQMHGATMTDHNWHRGGYGVLTVPEVLMFSSNIGVSRLIDEAYANDPDRYVCGLDKIGISENLHLPFVGAGHPIVVHPKKDRTGKHWANWYATKLPWMSIGYETQLPPINTVTFYNAIANGGKMMKPRFVKAVMREGKIIKEFPVEVVREQICKPSTLAQMQAILRRVVRDGLGKKAEGKSFPASGKTGTAQVSQGKGGYKSGGVTYFISFCGYFPSDHPRYSCIVSILKHGLPASGGGHCGPVFREISEAVMAKDNQYRLYAEDAADTLHTPLPLILKGDISATSHIMDQLGIRYDRVGQNASQKYNWGYYETEPHQVRMHQIATNRTIVPDLTDMGAKDAVYLLENLGLKVSLSGYGRVVNQSLPFGHIIKRGERIHLKLAMK